MSKTIQVRHMRKHAFDFGLQLYQCCQVLRSGCLNRNLDGSDVSGIVSLVR